MAKGKWQVINEYLGGKLMYRIGRLIDAAKPLEPENLEYIKEYGFMTNRDDALCLVQELNQEGAPKVRWIIAISPQNGGKLTLMQTDNRLYMETKQGRRCLGVRLEPEEAEKLRELLDAFLDSQHEDSYAEGCE